MLSVECISTFSLQRVHQGDVEIVAVNGDMGIEEYYQLEKQLRHLLDEEHRRVVLDCKALTFVTGASLARLCLCTREFRRHGGQFRLAGLRPAVNRRAQLVGFDIESELLPDLPAALKSLAPATAPSPKHRSKGK
jgi:anti-anti-sigma factor